jgi:hypothetical protein
VTNNGAPRPAAGQPGREAPVDAEPADPGMI